MFYTVKNKAEVFMSSVLTAIEIFKNQFSIICEHISEFPTLLKSSIYLSSCQYLFVGDWSLEKDLKSKIETWSSLNCVLVKCLTALLTASYTYEIYSLLFIVVFSCFIAFPVIFV